jgi:POT family proton-dependent oligopeptide transporter
MSEPKLTKSADDTAFFGHPRGLQTLFFTEMWERFSYYGMRAILILFMTAPLAAGGLAFTDAKAGMIYGIYTASVYLLSLPGGWIADRFLGQRKAVFHGGVLIMLGHICLAWPSVATFYLGLVFIALGTGLLKPNVSTMVGQLYTEEDARRDGGFSIYYMGINLGAFFAPLVCGTLAQDERFRGFLGGIGFSPESSWHFGFAAAAVGMFLGLVQYVLGDKALGLAGKHPVPAESPEAAAKNRRTLVYTLLAVFGLPAILAALIMSGTIVLTTGALTLVVLVVLVSVLTVFFAAMFLIGTWTPAEKRRLVLIMLLCFGATIFFADFEQAGSTLNLFAERNTTNQFLGMNFPASWLQSVNALFIIILAPVFGILWTVLGRRGKNPASPAKFAMGMFFLAGGFIVMLPAAQTAEAGQKAGPGWLIILYFLHTCAELCISPVGLSSMTKLAPARIAGMVMGMWFAAIALGNYLSGAAAGVTESLGMTTFFIAVAAPPVLAGILFAILNRPIHRMLGDDKVKH